MVSARQFRWWAGVALCLAALLSACGPQTITTEGPGPTPEPLTTSAPTTTSAQEATPPTRAVASPTELATPGSPAPRPTGTSALIYQPGPIRLTPVVPVVPLPTVAPGAGSTGVPQDLLDAILEDAETRSGLPAEKLTVVRAEAVVWPDGALGCPQPGMMYTQALAPGYWVVLEANGQELDYHSSRSGDFFLCDSPLPRQEPLPGED